MHDANPNPYRSGAVILLSGFILCALWLRQGSQTVQHSRLLLYRLNQRQRHTGCCVEQADTSVPEIEPKSMHAAVRPSRRHNDLPRAQAIHDGPLRVGLRHILQQPQGLRGVEAARRS